jgi:hypothetical protein
MGRSIPRRGTSIRLATMPPDGPGVADTATDGVGVGEVDAVGDARGVALTPTLSVGDV